MEIIRLRLLNPAQAVGNGKALKLSTQEIQAVTAHLRANVPEVITMLGDQIESLGSYVAECKVIEVSGAELENYASHRTIDVGVSTSSGGSKRVSSAPTTAGSKPDNSTKKTVFFKRGEPANSAILILSGRVEIVAGREGFKLELGAWSVLGQQSLISGDDQYIPDFSMSLKSPTIRVLCMHKAKTLSHRARQRTLSMSASAKRLTQSEGGSVHS